MKPRFRFTAIALFLACLQACGPEPVAAPSWLAGSATTTVAPSALTFSAVRRYADFLGTDPKTHVERVTVAPSDQVLVELLELNGVQVGNAATEDEQRAMDQLAAQMAAGEGRAMLLYRDFRARDGELLAVNYDWNIISESASIAGRPALVVSLKPKIMDRPSYDVWIDFETKVTLKCVERMPTGEVAAEMEVLSIDYAPNLTGVAFPAPVHGDQVEVPLGQVQSLAAFPLYFPTYLPVGFALRSVRTSVISGQLVVVMTWTDGVQELFLSQHAVLGPPVAAPPEGQIPDVPVKVEHLNAMGASREFGCSIEGTELFMMSKLDDEELKTVVESLDRVANL